MNISSLQRRITIVWDLPLLSNISTISHTHRIANTIYIGADCDFEIIDEFSATICPAVQHHLKTNQEAIKGLLFLVLRKSFCDWKKSIMLDIYILNCKDFMVLFENIIFVDKCVLFIILYICNLQK